MNKLCELHGTILRPQRVAVGYGLPVFEPGFLEARAKLFPNSKSIVVGGCCAGSFDPDYEALVCADCRKAEMRWRRGANWREEPWQHWTEK